MTVASHMSIFDHEPTDWADLQNRVAQLFSELGCEVVVGARLELVRGAKEIDVWVRDPHTSPLSQYLCECKFWNKPIPQEIVHSFRTVVSDYGAHSGFIISRAGFQAGAREAVRSTNVDLVTFPELQALFFDRWRIAMGKRWGKEHVERQGVLIDAYLPLVRLGPLLEMQGFVWNLPMTLPTLDDQGNINGTITLNSYRQLYDFIDQNKEVALRHFQLLYREADV
jgi:Restriction endonuclease